jgi:RHS repeat-associated protein
VVTDENGSVVQTLDYYPYGSTRISVATSTNERRKYIGEFSDDSGLNYLNSRYYSSGQAQFLSEDPAFLALGNATQIKQLVSQGQEQPLANPQQLNSYSYAQDNGDQIGRVHVLQCLGIPETVVRDLLRQSLS